MRRLLTAICLLAGLLANGQVIHRAEYIIDTDPGVGNGVAIPIGGSGESVSFEAPVPTAALADGFHNLLVRVQYDDGTWGLAESRTFYIMGVGEVVADVAAAEYFIDTDPGVGNGRLLTVGGTGASVTFTAAIPTAGLGIGFHNLMIRARDADGRWSLVENRMFYLSNVGEDAPDIVAVEYYIDADPGVGKGKALAINTAGGGVSLAVDLPTDGLAHGFHNLHIRGRDAAGNWGLVESRVFFITDQGLPAVDITDAEFFIDEDPGVGNGVPIAIGPAAGTAEFVVDVPTEGLTIGEHLLFVRAKSANGWGGAESHEFTIAESTKPEPPVIESVGGDDAFPVLTNSPTPLIIGTAEPGLSVEVFADGLSRGTVTADEAGTWSLTPAEPLVDGTHTLTAVAISDTDETSEPSNAVELIVDTEAPANVAISSVDGRTEPEFFTSNPRPVLLGTTDAGASVELFDGAASLGTVTADAEGVFSFTPTADLPDGNYAVTAVATDAAGNATAPTEVFAFTIDTRVPGVPIIATVDGRDDSPALINVQTPEITGTADPGVSVEIVAGTTVLGSATADANGGFAFVPTSAMTDGTHILSAVAVGPSGLRSAASETFTVNIDTKAPDAPLLTEVDGHTDEGFVTANNRLPIVGKAEPGATVKIFSGSASLGTVRVDESGNFIFVPSAAFPDGVYVLTAVATDDAGNTGEAGEGFGFTVDTTPPDAPLIEQVDGQHTPELLTLNRQPEVVGRSEPEATVEIYMDDQLVATVTTGADGVFRFVPPQPLEEGAYVLTAVATDGVGNRSTPGAAFPFTIKIDRTIRANNVLTPNGDGINDLLVFENLAFYPDNILRIVDRSGRLIYSRRNYANDWDGYLNGKPLAEGTYYYVLEVGDETPSVRSFVTIIRNNR
ncbi:Ig-like domain-containing protein [Parapedobacter sp.]